MKSNPIVLAALAAATSASAAAVLEGRTIERGPNTFVLKEINGIPDNKCITFRNNGETVGATCALDSLDQRVLPSTVNGVADVLLVVRTFSDGSRPDLSGKDVCLSFNGHTFISEDCAVSDAQLVSLKGQDSDGIYTLATAHGACLSGYDALSQIKVDATGAVCSHFHAIQVEATN